MKEIVYLFGATLEGCAAKDTSQDTASQLERTLEISYFEMEPDCIRKDSNQIVEYGDGSAYCTLDDSILMTIQLAYSGTGDEVNSSLLNEYHDDVLARSFSLSRDISADPYRFQGYWTTASTLNNQCCREPDEGICGTPIGAPDSITLTVEVTYLASKKEEFELCDVYIYDRDCAESE